MIGLLTVTILKRVSESIFSQSNKFTIKDKKRGNLFDGIQSTEDYTFISRYEKFKDLVKLQPITILN